MQEKGEVDEAELRALEEDVTGKIMLASWRGARLEVIQVLREVRILVSILVALFIERSLPIIGGRQRAQGTRPNRASPLQPRKGPPPDRRRVQVDRP